MLCAAITEFFKLVYENLAVVEAGEEELHMLAGEIGISGGILVLLDYVVDKYHRRRFFFKVYDKAILSAINGKVDLLVYRIAGKYVLLLTNSI